jgi:hypothetical protein
MDELSKRIKLSNGIELDLSNLSLKEVPSVIFELKDLEFINFGGNKLNSLPSDIKELRKLKTLFFANNDFESVPSVLGDLPELFMLSFKGNKIKHIDPVSLSPSIQWLILTDNQITNLPNSIGKLKKLRKLMLSGNKLTSLPEEMQFCRDLELIRLSSNNFEILPSWLTNLPKLAWIAISGNPSTTKDQTRSELQVLSSKEFTLKEKLGEGTSGVVSRATWNSKNIEVALKMFKSSTTSDGTPQEEIRASLHVGKHKNTIPTLGAVLDEERQGLIFSLIPKSYKSLGKPPSFKTVTRDVYEKDTYYSLGETVDILHGIASIGAHLHQRGLCHGDIYAHNILVDREMKLPALLCDYGAATFYNKLSMNIDLESVEVRAWGILADELLSLPSKDENIIAEDNQIKAQLIELKDQCLSNIPKNRPRFQEIADIISSFSILTKKVNKESGNFVGKNMSIYHIGGVAITAFCTYLILRKISGLFRNKSSLISKETW